VEDEENASKLDGQDLQYVVLDLGGMSFTISGFFFLPRKFSPLVTLA